VSQTDSRDLDLLLLVAEGVALRAEEEVFLDELHLVTAGYLHAGLLVDEASFARDVAAVRLEQVDAFFVARDGQLDGSGREVLDDDHGSEGEQVDVHGFPLVASVGHGDLLFVDRGSDLHFVFLAVVVALHLGVREDQHGVFLLDLVPGLRAVVQVEVAGAGVVFVVEEAGEADFVVSDGFVHACRESV